MSNEKFNQLKLAVEAARTIEPWLEELDRISLDALYARKADEITPTEYAQLNDLILSMRNDRMLITGETNVESINIRRAAEGYPPLPSPTFTGQLTGPALNEWIEITATNAPPDGLPVWLWYNGFGCVGYHSARGRYSIEGIPDFVSWDKVSHYAFICSPHAKPVGKPFTQPVSAQLPQNCREAGPGKGLCDQCAAGNYERCRYVAAQTVKITDEQICEALLDAGISPYWYPKSSDRFMPSSTKRIITAFRALLTQRQEQPSLSDDLRQLLVDAKRAAGIVGNREDAIDDADQTNAYSVIKRIDAILAQRQEPPSLSDREEDEYVIERLSTILAGVAIALKGEELPLHRHSYHDLADVARAKMLEIELLNEHIGDANKMVAAMVAALQKIARWQGEFPATGKTWKDGSPMSYAACYGSNGERDYMRKVALDTIAGHTKAPEAQGECDCQNPEPESGAALISNECPIHNFNPRISPSAAIAEKKPYSYEDFFRDAKEKGLTIHDFVPALRKRLAEIEAPQSTERVVASHGSMPDEQRDKWIEVDSRIRNDTNFVTYHIDAYNEGWHAALGTQLPNTQPATLDWVPCPVCGENHMQREIDADDKALIFCVNHGCKSNGGTMMLPANSFQQRVEPWMKECFGVAWMLESYSDENSDGVMERNHRFIEESLELIQACGATASEAHQLVDYVFGRKIGEKRQEVGGVMVTLAALCLVQKMDMHECGEIELARIWTKIEQIRAKQAAKPKHSPLP